MLLFIILKEKKTVPPKCSDTNTTHPCKQRGENSSCDNHGDDLFLSTTTKNFQEKMVNRLCNKFPGMILPERQSAQLVLFHINHEKPSKFKASREHRKQDKISIFSRNKII